MSTLLDVTQARADMLAYLMTTPYSITRSYPAPTTLTGVCAFGPMQGVVEEKGEQVQERGSYLMQVPIAADVLATDRIVIGARTFRVRYSPPATELSLTKQFGLEEVR